MLGKITYEYNVSFNDNGISKLYLGIWVEERDIALLYARTFIQKYVGKPYPNKKGFYPWNNVHVVCRERLSK